MEFCIVPAHDIKMFRTSQKGKMQLFFNGYYYVMEKSVGRKIYWRCTQYTTARKCHGRIHTLNDTVMRRTEHNHSGEKFKMKRDLREIY